MIVQTLEEFDRLQESKWTQQRDGRPPTKARKLSPKDGNIKWTAWTAEAVFGRWRALPAKTYSFFRGRAVKLGGFRLVDNVPAHVAALCEVAPGSICWDKESKAMLVKCSAGWVAIKEAHIVGKRHGSSEDFVNGYGLQQFKADNRFVYEDREASTKK